MDIGTGLTVLGGKDIIVKLLGPSANYLGEGLKDLTKKTCQNLNEILKNAQNKIGEKVNSTGAVPLKVLRNIVGEGMYIEDFISIEYFGGVLASSRTNIIRDDRGSYFTSFLSRLSTYQLRTHYIFYHLVKNLYNEFKVNFGQEKERVCLRVFISMKTYEKAMDIGSDEDLVAILRHSITGLRKEELIDPYYQFGDTAYIKQLVPEAESAGIIFQPSPLGVELFLWAYGKGNEPYEKFLDKSMTFQVDNRVSIDGEVRKLGKCK